MGYRAEIIKKIKESYPFLSEEFNVKRIGIFGSVVRHEEGPDSDIDIIVEFTRPIGLKFINFVEYIENLLGRRVDVLTKEGMKNIRVKSVSSDIEKNILYV